jgi:hypothetical protein
VASDEDEILAAELGKAGAQGASLGAAAGGALGGVSAGGLLGLAGKRGGAWGAAFAGRRLRNNVHEMELTLAAPSDEVFITVVSLIASMGRVVAQTGPSNGKAIVRGIVGAGTLNLNPAVVTVTMVPANGSGTSVRIRGAAKEGLIKQRAGQRASERLAASLR